MFQHYLAELVLETKLPIFSVNYRLAPECTDTTLAEDCYAGLLWLYENATRFNIDPRRKAETRHISPSVGGNLFKDMAFAISVVEQQAKLAMLIEQAGGAIVQDWALLFEKPIFNTAIRSHSA